MPKPHSLSSKAGWRTTTLSTRTPGWAIAHREITSMPNPNPPRVRSDRVNSIFKTDLQNVPGLEVLIFTSDWQPGFRLPLHIHPDGHEFVYVMEGEQTFEVEWLWH